MPAFLLPFADYLLMIGVVVLIFLVAFAAYRVLFFFIDRAVNRAPVARAGASRMRKAVFVLFLLLAAFIALDVLIFPETVDRHLRHTLLVLIIATIGLGFILTARGVYGALLEKYRKESIEDISRRSLLTQTQILYRFFIFVIVVLTISCILITFPSIRSLGFGLLGSAGVASIALGIAARPILLNMLAGVQLALTKIVKIGDVLFVEGEMAKVEHLFLTHAVLETWDQRRLVLPISTFIDKPFQNWSSPSGEFIGWAVLHLDYTVPLNVVREKFFELLQNSSYWNRGHWNVEVVDTTESTMVVRLSMSARGVGDALTLRTDVRERMIAFLQEEYPGSLPRVRFEEQGS